MAQTPWNGIDRQSRRPCMGQFGKGRFPRAGQFARQWNQSQPSKRSDWSGGSKGGTWNGGRILRRIKSVFTYAIRTERAENNPAVPLGGLIKAPKQKHQPALPQSELIEFYRRLMLKQAKQQTKIAMQLIMLTLVRNKELRAAEWSEFDLDGTEWSIPAAKMKMKAPHIVSPLPIGRLNFWQNWRNWQDIAVICSHW